MDGWSSRAAFAREGVEAVGEVVMALTPHGHISLGGHSAKGP
ncbi:hypothetical protein PoMZ_00421 [Pyricularia oryzae]|uniref:Uncharacterized protein n=1 Tax=Pyricularia oryzae TaxID=318829 RepID=A0A4P7N245_PYROR|nr:hypothetical protein PoMZ_00421 [Pyricularia oryzae]